MTAAEQGDSIEIRLDERTPADGRWRLSRQSGDGRVEARGEAVIADGSTTMTRVFRFRALGAGSLELVFAFDAPRRESQPQEVVTFTLLIR